MENVAFTVWREEVYIADLNVICDVTYLRFASRSLIQNTPTDEGNSKNVNVPCEGFVTLGE